MEKPEKWVHFRLQKHRGEDKTALILNEMPVKNIFEELVREFLQEPQELIHEPQKLVQERQEQRD